MVPASYLFKDVHERHWGAAPHSKGPAVEEAYYASVSGAPIAITRLWRGIGTAVASVLTRTATARSRAPRISNDVACRA